MTSRPPEDDVLQPADERTDPVVLVARIAEALPALDADALERLARALDELSEAVGLALDVNSDLSPEDDLEDAK